MLAYSCSPVPVQSSTFGFAMPLLRFASWNVNGFRALSQKPE